MRDVVVLANERSLDADDQHGSNEPVITDFKQAKDLNFMSRQGRVLSPLEAEDLTQGEANTSLLD